jgi:hypothetical protein
MPGNDRGSVTGSGAGADGTLPDGDSGHSEDRLPEVRERAGDHDREGV